jgi:uncharacterized phiE125 gp8 family phage protein
MKFLRSVLVEAATSDPVALADAKRRVRRVEDDDDGEIGLIVAAVTSHLDGATGILGRALITQDWSDVWCGFPASERVRVALAPVQEIVSISYFDADNQVQTLEAGRYSLHADATGFYIRADSEAGWPDTFDRDDAMSITYRAGYGDTDQAVPATLRLAILDLVAHRYNNREAVVVGTIASNLPRSVAADLAPFTRPHF